MPRPATVAEPTGICSLTLAINADLYRVRCRRDRSGDLVVRLINVEDGRRVYDVQQVGSGVFCSCGDFRYRRSATVEGCKHTRALVAVGLLPPPA